LFEKIQLQGYIDLIFKCQENPKWK